MSNMKERISKIRFKFLIRQPFLGDLALRLIIKEANEIVPTAGVDGRNFYYNHDFIKNLSEEHLEGVIGHEVAHCVFQHCGKYGVKRMKKHNKDVWTIACEYSANYFTKDLCKLDLPGVPFDIKKEKAPASSGKKKNENDLEMHFYDNKYSDGSWTTESIYYDLMESDNIKEMMKNKAAMEQMLKDAMNDDHSKWGEGQGKNCDDIDKDWKIWVAQAAQAAKKQGKLPAGIERLVEDILDPKLPWRSYLAEFLVTQSKDDYSWRRPNRRQIWRGIHAPSLHSENINFAYFMDTSGSMSDQELAEGLAEVRSICDTFPSFNLYAAACDAKVHYFEHVKAWDDLDTSGLIRGGGGTRFEPCFEKVEEEEVELNCAVYFTDGYGSFPDEAPPYPVLWVVKGNIDESHFPFGKVIYYD